METTYKGYKTAMTINGTKLKGLFKWVFAMLVFAVTYMWLFGANYCNFCVMMFYFGGCAPYQIYDGYTNRPNVLSVLPLSDKKRLLYSYRYAVTEMIAMFIAMTALFILFGIFDGGFDLDNILLEIRSYFPDNKPVLSAGNMFPLIMALGVYFTMPALAYIKDKKMWYCAAGILYVLNLIWGIVIYRALNPENPKAGIIIGVDFSSLPHYRIIFAAFCIFAVLEIAAGVVLAYKIITKKSK